jgi:hypothetical protein
VIKMSTLLQDVYAIFVKTLIFKASLIKTYT